MNFTGLRILQDEFRRWYGMISVEELMSNHQLVELIKRIEKYFMLGGNYELSTIN